MKPSLAIVIVLLPYTALSLYDESSLRKVKLEDIEEEHLQSERRSKAVQPPSLPPPLSKQPAKGQPTKTYPPIAEDRIKENHKQNPTTTHRYSTRAQHHVQPLTDQPTAPEADYQQSPAYQSETIVYLPANAHGQPLLQENTLQQQYEVVQRQQQQQQPSPVFYYSHDIQQQQLSGNGYQVQFVPIGQHGWSDEQRTYTRPEGTVPSTNVAIAPAPASVVSYSHDSAYGGAQVEAQQQEQVQYVTSNEIREPNNIQQVYGLPGNAFFESQKDIEYAKPTNVYGPPPMSQQPYSNRHKDIEYSQEISVQKPYSSVGESQPAQRPSPTYGPAVTPVSYFSHQKDIEYAPAVETETAQAQKPAITYGPPDTVGHIPQIQYGVPDAPFRRPVSQSNQNAYAPRRPDSSGRSNEKPFAVSFPYPPSFVSITTQRPFYDKSTPTPEPAYNEISQWQANVMPLHLIPPQDTQYSSYGTTQAIQVPTPTQSPDVNQHIDSQSAPLIDFFHSRRAKSLLDSYIPSWLVARMQEEHARQLRQQGYAIPPTAPETGYNTIAYSTQFENIYGKHFKRSIQRSKAHQKKKAPSSEDMTAMA